MRILDEKSNGFTLVELIIVIAILGIIAAIAVSRLSGIRELAEKKVCDYNIKQLEKEFRIYMVDHPDQPEPSEATDFLFIYELNNKICPSNSVVTYSNENGFKCSTHNEINEENPPDGEVPWL